VKQLHVSETQAAVPDSAMHLPCTWRTVAIHRWIPGAETLVLDPTSTTWTQRPWWCAVPRSGKVEEVREKSGEVKSGVFFEALNTPKLIFRPGLCPGLRCGSLRCWGGGYPIPFPQLLQPQLLNNWLSGLTPFFINMKQWLLTISVNTWYRVNFTWLYWKSQGISCGLESGHSVESPQTAVLLHVKVCVRWK